MKEKSSVLHKSQNRIFPLRKNKKAKDHLDKIPSDAIELLCPTVATWEYLNLN